MKQVRQLTSFVAQYRKPFFERAREILRSENVNYEVVYGQPTKNEATKGDYTELSWGKEIHNRYIDVKGLATVWQPAWSSMRGCDLAIISQENRLLINYPLQMLRSFGSSRLALWGHGKNFQTKDDRGCRERWKRFWATKCDWWFGYTLETRSLLISYGYSPQRITVLNNSVDTSELRRYASEIDSVELQSLRETIGVNGKDVGVFVGGLHQQKRLPFLIDAAKIIKKTVPAFELIIVGGGPEYAALKDLASAYPWIKVVGPKFGRDKVRFMMLGRIFLMPGLVGLSILDSGIVGLPIVTTAVPFHSPEIAYLESGRNGIVVSEWQSVSAFAQAVADLFHDESRLAQMSLTAREIAQKYTIEEMATRFSAGVISALRV